LFGSAATGVVGDDVKVQRKEIRDWTAVSASTDFSQER
jgi:hypothetical protein